MRVVIIGGGIAGLTLGALLHEKNIDFVINERNTGSPSHGHAFLMHTDGLAVLNELSADYHTELPGNIVDTFSLSRTDGQEVKRVPLDSWKCIKREDMLFFLTSLLPENCVKTGRQFSHFLYENGKAAAAVFNNGDIEYGDIFIGADGSNSKVRQAIFGPTAYTPTQVKEFVGIAPISATALQNLASFNKFQRLDRGLSFGYIPVSDKQMVWYMQYNIADADSVFNSPEAISSFCRAQLEEFPEAVQSILASNDFSTTYLWKTTDFDLLPAFHQQNIAVIGDAAHLALPFTSSGTTNAVIDAKIMVQCLDNCNSYEDAFTKFYSLRAAEVTRHTELGRQLQHTFLNPLSEIEAPLPLMARSYDAKSTATEHRPIQVLYFTDPICSTCWIIQPQLRKLKMEYGRYLNFQYLMGGLLSCWEDGNTGSIKSPGDAARHWDEACRNYDMPMDGDVWIEDPLHSSYPPSIAFKAAQLQDEGKALRFLRRIQEMVFMEKKNIIKWRHIENAAFEAGLDCARLLADFKTTAPEHFKTDLELTKKYGVTGFPTLFFSDGNDRRFMLRGNQPYEQFESIVLGLVPDAQKAQTTYSASELFNLYPSLTEKEFKVLANHSEDDVTGILNNLAQQGIIESYKSKNGIIWKSKVV